MFDTRDEGSVSCEQPILTPVGMDGKEFLVEKPLEIKTVQDWNQLFDDTSVAYPLKECDVDDVSKSQKEMNVDHLDQINPETEDDLNYDSSVNAMQCPSHLPQSDAKEQPIVHVAKKRRNKGAKANGRATIQIQRRKRGLRKSISSGNHVMQNYRKIMHSQFLVEIAEKFEVERLRKNHEINVYIMEKVMKLKMEKEVLQEQVSQLKGKLINFLRLSTLGDESLMMPIIIFCHLFLFFYRKFYGRRLDDQLRRNFGYCSTRKKFGA